MSDIYRNSIFWVEVERINPNPYQPRREFDQAKLNGLAESIRMYGLLQPLTVTRNETAKEDGGINVLYELVAGERRLRASKIAGLKEVPVIIRSGEDTDQMKLELAIIENLQREDLNPVDRAKAFLRLHKDFKFTHVEIGKKMGKSREYVSNTLRLLLLPESILGYLAEGRMSEGHTRPLLMLNDKPEEQAVLAKEILLKKLTVRESEMLARRSAQDKVTERYKINPEILTLEKKLTEKLGTRVQIEQKEVGGKLVISFFSAEDLSALLENMQLENERNTVTTVFNGNPNAPTESLSKKVEAQKEQETKMQETQESEHVEAEETQEKVDTEEVTDSTKESTESDAQVNAEDETPTDEPIVSESTQESPEKGIKETEHAVESHPLLQSEESTTPIVRPSEDRPLPEPQAPVLSAFNIQEEVKTDEPSALKPTPLPKEEEDADLYSIRNFSI